jgi:rSAM/selenodomain-associated transferase 1
VVPETPRPNEDLLAILARDPVVGRGKTRLAAAIGPQAAAELYRAFLLDLELRLGGERGWSLLWVYEPPGAPFAERIGTRCPTVPQVEGDLGMRMAAAMHEAIRRGAKRVVLVGSDVPHLDPATVAEAFARLREGADLVLGPAEDGGYYLIGARSVPPVFDGVSWGGSEVFVQTVARARRAGLRLVEVARTYDIDSAADLRRLAQDPALALLPATRKVLHDPSRGIWRRLGRVV